jgi:hypothetical protein
MFCPVPKYVLSEVKSTVMAAWTVPTPVNSQSSVLECLWNNLMLTLLLPMQKFGVLRSTPGDLESDSVR